MDRVRILIVEDELLIAKNLSRKLENLGYSIVNIVSDGDRAITNAIELKPDLILMDIVIKGDLDGIEVAQAIYQQLEIPIIFTTAYADDKTLERAEQTGSYGYLIKPFQERDLHATIKIALKKHREAHQLKESLVTAQAIEENQSCYLAMTSHDLKIPLTNIQMSADLLQHYEQNFDEDKKAKHFLQIQNSIANIKQMLNDVLTISQAESGKLEVKLSRVVIGEFCHSILAELHSSTLKKHQLLLKIDREDLQVNIDIDLLHHILMNLLSNAIKYSPEGGEIRLEVAACDREIVFKIKDRGIGIPQEEQQAIFQKFGRATNVGKIQGTGLGLWFVKHLIELQNGQIVVDSKPDRGTTFTVTIPVTI